MSATGIEAGRDDTAWAAVASVLKHDRRKTLLAAMAASELDAVVLVPGANFRFLTGGVFPLRERPTLLVVMADGDAFAIVPGLEEPSWKKLSIEADVALWTDAEGYESAFRRMFAGDWSGRRVGVEGQLMRAFELMVLEACVAGAIVIDAHKEISAIRLAKDLDEVLALRRAIALTEAALAETIRHVRVGMSEREIQTRLLMESMATGSEGLAFPPTVAGGPNSAMSHAKASDYRLQRGDVLLFDFGLAWEGYRADITRTFFVGDAAAADLDLYRVVQEANELGRSSARPGLAAGVLDETVTGFLKGSAYADQVRHRTGHGLGLEIHEDP
ncbi:MAG: M24 family metallopeptidase, partial [Rhizobiaceae bacterium]